jgi:hypothetical protein
MVFQQRLALEAAFPELALASVFPIGAPGNRLVERLHEPAQAPQAFSQLGQPVGVADNGQHHVLCCLCAVVVLEPSGKGRQPASGYFFVGQLRRGRRVNVKNDMIMIIHALTAPLQGFLPFRQTALSFSPARATASLWSFLPPAIRPIALASSASRGNRNCSIAYAVGGVRSPGRCVHRARTERHAGHRSGLLRLRPAAHRWAFDSQQVVAHVRICAGSAG